MKLLPTLLALATSATCAHSAIVWSGVQDIAIPSASGPGAGFDGVYLNVVTGASTTSADDDFATTDVNFFLGGFAIRSSADFRPARQSAASDSPVINLLPGSSVDMNLNFGPTEIGVSDNHVGSAMGQFANGSEGFLGFIIDNNGNEHFGWMRVTLTSNGEGTIHEFAYDDVAGQAITVGTIPEPSTMLLGFVALGSSLLRRKR